MSDFFLIAKVVSVYDKKGSVRIKSFSDFPERFNKLKFVFIDFFGEKKKIEVEKVKAIDDFFVLKFKNFNNEADCSFLLNKDIFVKDKDAVVLNSDTFFIHDLIGSQVFFDNAYFGKIVDVYKLPANDVYVINDKVGKEILIPALKSLIEYFNPKEKIMVLKQITDLYEQDED